MSPDRAPEAGGWWAKIKMNQEKCEGCFYFKVRDVDSDTGVIAWGPFCLESGQPIKCEVAILECVIKGMKNAPINQ